MTTPHKGKIFCIGLNKTGTTSFGDALQNIGLKRLGWRGTLCANLFLRWYEQKREPFIEAARKYDVMEDLPWPLVYDWMEQTFHGAKFVLTTRESTEVWLKSIQAHILRHDSRPYGRFYGHRMIYGSYDPLADATIWAARYEHHNASVRKYFSTKPGKLLDLVVGNGDEGEKLAAFLGYDKPIVFPHSNKRPDLAIAGASPTELSAPN